jgi:hypothetical protein
MRKMLGKVDRRSDPEIDQTSWCSGKRRKKKKKKIKENVRRKNLFG